MIVINEDLSIPDEEIELQFIRAGGPGGQNVNKVSTAVQLRFDLRASTSLSQAVKRRLEKLAGRRLTIDGVIVIAARSHRTQEANRRDALERLIKMIREALIEPKRRVPTKPSKAERERRLQNKAKRSGTKRLRGGKIGPDD